MQLSFPVGLLAIRLCSPRIPPRLNSTDTRHYTRTCCSSIWSLDCSSSTKIDIVLQDAAAKEPQFTWAGLGCWARPVRRRARIIIDVSVGALEES